MKQFIGFLLVLGVSACSSISTDQDSLIKRQISEFSAYKSRPSIIVEAPETPRRLALSLQQVRVASAFESERIIDKLDDFMEGTGSTSFLVLKDGELIYEAYYHGYEASSPQALASATKSLTSILVGQAIKRGAIDGVDDKVADYVPRLNRMGSPFSEITIADLLDMRSGIKSDIGLSLNTQSEFGAYTKENLIRIVFENLKREKPRGTFEYSNFEYLLLGMAIDGRKNKSARALHDGLQVPLGAEFDLIWNTDDNGFLHYEGGAVMAAPDLAKVGQMMLDGGEVAGMPLISRAWHARSTGFKRDIQFDSENGPQIQFQNGWRQVLRPHGPPDYFAAGDLGQFLYVSPSHNVVIVRNGFSYGHIPFKDWIVVFYNAATRLDH